MNLNLRKSFTRLFKRVSQNSNVQKSKSSKSKHYNYISLFQRNDSHMVSYHIGKSILRDTQVGTGFDILKYLLSSKKWVLTDMNEDDSTVYDFIHDMLINMQTDLNTLVKQISPAILWGFNVHEILYDLNEDGRIIIKDIVPVHIKTLQQDPFTYGEDGELVSIHQNVDTQNIEIPIDKVILYSYNSLYDEKEGQGLLYDFLPIVEDKENLMDWVMTFAEKNGSPTMYGKTNDPTSRDAMLNAFDDIADGTTGMVGGVEDDVKVLESSHKGEVYFSTLQYKDNQIFRRMFIGNLLMGDNSQTGTYAQSQTQLEFGQLVFDGILEEIAKTLQKQIINRVTELNFGTRVKAPTISFDKFTSGDMQKLFTIIQPLMKDGVIDSENSAVHEALALLFKAESGVEYVNEEPEMPEENFDYQPPVQGTDGLTNDIIDDLNAIAE